MKGCTRTVKADLVAIPRQADERSGTAGIAIPLDTKPPVLSSLYFSTDPTMSTRMGRDSIAKRYSY